MGVSVYIIIWQGLGVSRVGVLVWELIKGGSSLRVGCGVKMCQYN